MKIFIETANLDHIRELSEYSIISGVTTNPSLMAKEGISCKENCQLKDWIFVLSDGPCKIKSTDDKTYATMKPK